MTLTRHALAGIQRAAQAEAEKREALGGLLPFIEEAMPTYEAGWVHRDICQRLERFSAKVARRESPRLIICLPPRSGKTEIVGRKWPVWHLSRYPWHEVVYGTYGQDLSNKVSRHARATAERYQQRNPYLARGEVWGVEFWETAGGGSFNATSVGGALTGQGANLLILDDMIKDSMAAMSKTVRDSTWEWYQTTAYTRLAPGGGVLIMHTRWHEGDPIGRALREAAAGGDQWEIVSYPAIAECDELHRKEGEALHPERYDLAALERIRGVLGSRAWAALYQQRPSPASGSVFKRAWMNNRWKEMPHPSAWTSLAISVDCTFKDSKHSDYVAMQVWGQIGASRYLLDQVRARMDYPATKAAMKDLCAKWPKVGLKVIEEAANGAALIADLRNEIPGLVGYRPKASKEARASVAAAQFEAGNVFLPASAPWVGDYIEELCSFPSGLNDDQVDATSQMLIRWGETMPALRFGGFS